MTADKDHDLTIRVDEWRRAHEQVHAREAEARVFAAHELERRLGVLNHYREEALRKDEMFVQIPTYDLAHQAIVSQLEQLRARLEQGAYVTRELFDSSLRDQAEKHSRVLDQLSVTYNDISNMKGRNTANAAAITIFFTVVTIVVAVLSRVL